MNKKNPLTARRIAAIQAAITDKRLDVKEIAAATFTSEAYTTRLMRWLLEAKLVRVSRWRLCARTYAAVYSWGCGRSASLPKPITTTECQRRFRARLRKDPEANEFYLAKMRARDRAATAAKKPATWLSALGV